MGGTTLWITKIAPQTTDRPDPGVMFIVLDDTGRGWGRQRASVP